MSVTFIYQSSPNKTENPKKKDKKKNEMKYSSSLDLERPSSVSLCCRNVSALTAHNTQHKEMGKRKERLFLYMKRDQMQSPESLQKETEVYLFIFRAITFS